MTNILIKELKNHPKVIKAMIETLKSLIEKDDVEAYYKVGEFYYFWDDLEEGHIFGKLFGLDDEDSEARFCVQLPSGSLSYFYKYASKDYPKI